SGPYATNTGKAMPVTGLGDAAYSFDKVSIVEVLQGSTVISIRRKAQRQARRLPGPCCHTFPDRAITAGWGSPPPPGRRISDGKGRQPGPGGQGPGIHVTAAGGRGSARARRRPAARAGGGARRGARTQTT